MNQLDCVYVRDIYPDVLNGGADDALAQRVHAHVAQCADCRAEIALVNAIHAETLVVPAGLEARVTRVLRQPPVRWWVSPGAIGLAATLGAALIGGSIFMRAQLNAPTPTPAASVRAPAAHGLGAVGVDDAMLSGKSSLDDLSVEQLEQLLGEVQS
jgi:anti-sigma factor RsiW